MKKKAAEWWEAERFMVGDNMVTVDISPEDDKWYYSVDAPDRDADESSKAWGFPVEPMYIVTLEDSWGYETKQDALDAFWSHSRYAAKKAMNKRAMKKRSLSDEQQFIDFCLFHSMYPQQLGAALEYIDNICQNLGLNSERVWEAIDLPSYHDIVSELCYAVCSQIVEDFDIDDESDVEFDISGIRPDIYFRGEPIDMFGSEQELWDFIEEDSE